MKKQKQSPLAIESPPPANWSPWGRHFVGKNYLQVPHAIWEILDAMNPAFEVAEQTVVLVFFSYVLPGRESHKVSLQALSRRSGKSISTVQRTIRKMMTHGMTVATKHEPLIGEPTAYDISKFLEAIESMADRLIKSDVVGLDF